MEQRRKKQREREKKEGKSVKPSIRRKGGKNPE